MPRHRGCFFRHHGGGGPLTKLVPDYESCGEARGGLNILYILTSAGFLQVKYYTVLHRLFADSIILVVTTLRSTFRQAPTSITDITPSRTDITVSCMHPTPTLSISLGHQLSSILFVVF